MSEVTEVNQTQLEKTIKVESPQERLGLNKIQEGLAEYFLDNEEPIDAISGEGQPHRADIEPKPGEIQREAWQLKINEAFQRGDYETIGTLERVTSEVRPSAELVQARVHTLVTTREGRWAEEVSHIRDVANIDPNDPVIAEEFGKLLTQFGNEKGILAGLKEFKEVTGYTPPEEVVQEKYRSIISRGHSYSFNTQDLVRDIRELTGIRPDRVIFDEVIEQCNLSRAKEVASIFGVEITDEMAQRAFSARLEHNGSLDTYTIKESGFKPSEETVQQAYGKIITTAQRGSHWVRQVQELEEVTGVKPQFTQEQVEPIYREYLSRGWYGREGYEGIEQIMGMTGIRPTAELVQTVAVSVIGENARDPKRLQGTLSRLESSTGIKVEVPPEQIQEAYQKALTKRDAQAIIGIASVLGVTPEIDPETARQFLVSYIDQPYNNPIKDLQKVFGIDFHAKPEEVAAKYQENFEKLNFAGIDSIRDITGAVPDRDRVVQAVRDFTEKKFAERPSGYSSSSDWTTSVKQILDKYQVSIPQEQITAFYERCIDGTIDTQKLAQLNSLFGTNISPELAQQAYQRVLQGNQQTFYSPGSTIESIYKLSGEIKPELPAEQVQAFYTQCLTRGNVDTDSIGKISAITDIEPHFDPQTINTIYRDSLLSGNAYKIERIKAFTGVEFVVDDQTKQAASQAVDQQIAGIIEKDYEWSNSDSDRIRKIIEITGVTPNPEAMQAYYRSLLADSPKNWSEKIDKLVAATGVSPNFTPEEIRERAEQLLKSGQSANLERLSKFGSFTLESEVATDGYQVLFASIKDGDGYYAEQWLERFKRVQAATGVPPTAEQLGEIISHLSRDRQYVGRSYSGISSALDTVEKTFGVQPSPELVGQVYTSLFQEGDLRSIDNLKSKTGIAPQIHTEVIQARVDSVLKEGKLQDLYEVQRMLGVDKLPVNEEIVQEKYRELADNPDFGNKYRQKSTNPFYDLYKLTGVRPNLTPEQLARGFRNTMSSSTDGTFESFTSVVGVQPTTEDLHSQVYRWFSGRETYREYAAKFIERNNIQIPEELAKKAILENLSKTTLGDAFNGFIKNTEWIETTSGLTVTLENDELNRALIGMSNRSEPIKYSSSTNLVNHLEWLNTKFGFTPSRGLVDAIYEKTWESHVNSRSNDSYPDSYPDSYKITRDGEEFQGVWEWLKAKHGLPSGPTVQTVYLQQVLDGTTFWLDSRTRAIHEFSELAPNIDEMTKIGLERGLLKDGDNLSNRLQSIYRDELLSGRVNSLIDLQDRFQVDLKIAKADLQVIYAKVLMGKHEHQKEVFDYLAWHSGVLPSPEIIQARYKELFAGDRFRAEDVAAFQEVVKTPPSKEVLQGKYKELFEKYVKTYQPAYDENDVDDNGERFLEEITAISQGTGIPLQLDKEFVMSMYEYCVSQGEGYHPKLGVIAQYTGVEIDRDFIQKHILDNKDFSSAVPFGITSEQLDEYFSNPEHKSLAEYKRVYSVFGCYDSYQNVLTNLQEAGTTDAKKQTVEILAAMGLRDIGNSEQYSVIKERILLFGREDNRTLDKTVALALAELAKRGDGEITNHLAEILRRRGSGKEQDEGRRTIGFTEEQEIALRTLMQLDNPLANEALFSLVFTTDIDPRVKALVARNLTDTKNDFFPENMRTWIKANLENDSRSFDWEDFKFFQATLRIPSADLRRRSRRQLNDAFEMFTKDGRSIAQTHQEICPSIPENTFMQLWKFTRGNEELATKFNNLYSVTKSAAHQDALLFGIVNALSVNRQVQAKVVDQLGRIDFVSKDGAEQMARMLKTVAFLDTVERQLGQRGNSEVFSILDAPVDSMDQLNASLKEVVVEKIKEVLPNEAIDADKIQTLWEQWGSLEPIFVYASKMASSRYDGTLRLVAEMVARMDPPTYGGWKEWRYNLNDRRVNSQIGHLTGEQIDVWTADYFAELGDIMIATSPVDRPRQVVSQLETAIREGHVYNPDIDKSDKYKFIQERLTRTQELLVAQPDQREQILTGEIQLLQEDMGRIDSIIRAGGITRVQQALSMFASGQSVQINKRAFDTIKFLEQFLNKEQYQAVQSAMTEAEKSGATTVEATSIMPAEIAQSLSDTVRNIQESFAQTMDSDIFERYGLDKEQLKNMGQFYQKRQELKSLMDLYRLGKLNSQLIATNKITDRTDKRGETISSVIDGLRKFFKDSPTFLQDIDNLQATITHKEVLGANRRLAMLITDNPQILFQVGKYPTGCGSCQNYEGSPEWNKALAGYVADAHTKATFLIDLNKLSSGIRQEIETRGFEEVKDAIPPQELLEASVGRSIMKLVQMQNGAPVLFIEPTYTQINKGDLSMNKYFDIFAELMITNPMDIQLVRGAGSETVTVAGSRNPSGQYEDAAAANAGHAGMGIQQGSYTMSARVINKFSPVTEADRALAEMISQSNI